MNMSTICLCKRWCMAALLCVAAQVVAAQPFSFVALGDLPYGQAAQGYAPYKSLILPSTKNVPIFRFTSVTSNQALRFARMKSPKCNSGILACLTAPWSSRQATTNGPTATAPTMAVMIPWSACRLCVPLFTSRVCRWVSSHCLC